jgi:hypothetical protein
MRSRFARNAAIPSMDVAARRRVLFPAPGFWRDRSARISVYGICALNVALAIVLPHEIAIRPPSVVIS